MIPHVWSDQNDNSFLMSNPVSCVSDSTVKCDGSNGASEFWIDDRLEASNANLNFLGSALTAPSASTDIL